MSSPHPVNDPHAGRAPRPQETSSSELADPHAQSPGDDLGFDLPPPARFSKTRLAAAGAAALLLLGAAFASAYLPGRKARADLEAGVQAAERAAPRVEVVTPVAVSSDRALVLPGSIQPLEETIVYPRANGYVRRWLVDLGDKVEEGQVLAEIDTPELDRELAQARAQLAQAKAGLAQAHASRELSQSNKKRYEQMVPEGVASQQELEQWQVRARADEASVAVAQAQITAQEANLQRIREMKTFAKIVAPFAGTVTARMVERGALVAAGNATPLFKISATDTVRVFVGVPQSTAPSVKVGASAVVTVREFAGQQFQGTVARAAGALDAATRTMNTEVRVPNPDGKLLAGMYAEVALTLPSPHRVLEVPATALYNDAQGLRVAVVDAGGKVRFVPITIERDTGPTIQVATGLDGTERVVKLANAELADGMTVELLAPSAPAPSAAPSAGAGPSAPATAAPAPSTVPASSAR